MLLDYFTYCAGHLFMFHSCETCHKSGGINHEESPANNKHQQGYCSLVDFSHTLDSYKEIADDESDDNSNC